jgi:DNA-binding transcriptional ArsR family regulator
MIGLCMSVDQLNAVFGALADPTRRAILARLTQGDATVAELAAPFSVSL